MFTKLTKSVRHSRAAQTVRKAGGKMCMLQLSALKAVQKHTKKNTPHGCIWLRQVIDCSRHGSLGPIPWQSKWD